MKILIADKFPASHVEALRSAGHDVTLNPSLADDALTAALPGAEVLIVRSTKVRAQDIDAGSSLKMVIRAGSGYNTIATDYAATKGVAVTNCPGMNAIAVAELAMGMILALDRHLVEGAQESRAGKWDKARFGKANGIFGRTLGLVGAGQIGAELTRRALAFGMKVRIYDPYLAPEKITAMGAIVAADLMDIARNSDFISVHVPKTAQTTHLIGTEFLEAMKIGATLIHTSRGGVVDDAALLAALDRKALFAGLDVYEDEPAASKATFENPLAAHPRVLATHHIGASTEQAEDAVADEVLNIMAALVRGEMLHRVN